jgi:hypothetical protein
MAIDFSSDNLFKAPKINFIPEDVPLEAFEKSSEILNKRYETSADAATKAQEALVQQLQKAHPLEREAIQSFYDKTYGDLSKIATDDDYIDQEWKTRSLAMRTAANLQTQIERAKMAQETVDKIRLTKEITDPGIRKMYEDEYNEQFRNTKYDPDRGLLNFSEIQAPKIVTDANAAEILNKGLTGMMANQLGRSSNDVQFILPGQKIPGTNTIAISPTAYDIKNKSVIRKLEESEVREAGRNLLKATPEVQAVLERDAKYYKRQNPQLNDAQAIELAKQRLIEPALRYAELKFGFKEDMRDTDVDLNSTLTNVLSSVYGPKVPTDTNFWIAHTPEVDTKGLVEPAQTEKAEVASQAFNKDGSFKEVPSTWIEKYAKITGWMAGDVNDLPNSKDFNTLVPKFAEAIIKKDNPTFTPKQIYEKFMDQKIDYKKKMISYYTIADSETRSALNKSLADFGSMHDVYDREGNEITDPKQRAEIFKQQASFIPATGQIIFGRDYVSGLGVMNPNVPQTNPTQKTLAAASKMINAALNPEIYSATTRDMLPEGITVNYNGQPTTVNFRVMKTNVGKKVINGRQAVAPGTIQMVTPNGQILRSFVVDDQYGGQQGLNNFINFMLNSSALKYTL